MSFYDRHRTTKDKDVYLYIKEDKTADKLLKAKEWPSTKSKIGFFESLDFKLIVFY